MKIVLKVEELTERTDHLCVFEFFWRFLKKLFVLVPKLLVPKLVPKLVEKQKKKSLLGQTKSESTGTFNLVLNNTCFILQM